MGRWGKADFSGLKQLEQQLAQAQQEIDKMQLEIVRTLEQEFLKGVIARTPKSETNGLKNHWKSSIQKMGTSYILTVYNDLEYASFVEYGHRNQNGGFTPGRYMLKITEQEIMAKMNNIQAPIIERHLREIFK